MKTFKKNTVKLLWFPIALLIFSSCKKEKKQPASTQTTLKVENILQAKTLSQSGIFKGENDSAVILPGEQISFSFSAGKGQTLTFATMYGFSNDLFFAPENPGIALYDKDGVPVEGDVSDKIKLWDNGTRINQPPGANVVHPGDAEADTLTEINGTDKQNNAYLPANALMKIIIKHIGNSVFTCTIENTSGGTANETPFSPGVWAVSNILGGNLLNAMPFYEYGKAANANGITPLAEMGDNSQLYTYAMQNTGVFTPLSPVLIVVYNGENPVFKTDEKDKGNGLKDIAQKGDATALEAALKTMPGVTNVYVAATEPNKILLPALQGNVAGSIEQKIDYEEGDKITFVTMFGYSNDWFFSFGDEGADIVAGDLSNSVMLFDDGTAVDQFPGAGNSQGAIGGKAQTTEDNPIQEISDTYPVPAVSDIIRITISKN